MTRETNMEDKRPLRMWLFNPFYYVAGGTALAIGLPVTIVASLNGSLSLSHFDGVLDFHTGLGTPLWFYAAEGPIDWLVMSVLLLAAGWMISKSRIRVIDVFGTQALARTPTLMTALAAMLPGYQRQAARLAVLNLDAHSPDLAAFIMVCIVTVAMIAWMVVLMYRAFAVSCNVCGAKAIVVFGIMLLVGEAISKMIMLTLLQYTVG
jgi:hypothetical protein